MPKTHFRETMLYLCFERAFFLRENYAKRNAKAAKSKTATKSPKKPKPNLQLIPQNIQYNSREERQKKRSTLSISQKPNRFFYPLSTQE